MCLEGEAEFGVESPVFSVLLETPEKGEPRPFGLSENKVLEDAKVVGVVEADAVSTLSSFSITIGFLPFDGELVGVLMVRFGLRGRIGEDGSGIPVEVSGTL